MFTDYFIKRPVITITLMVVICLGGLLSLGQLPYRLFPHVTLFDVQVSASYPGASATQMKARITSILEESINDVEDVTHVSAVTRHGYTAITAHLEIGGDYKHAFATILEKVKSARGLPADLDPPVVRLVEPERAPDLAIAFYSEQMQREQVSEYLTRVMKPDLESLEGISSVEVLGSQYALRIWLDPQLMNLYDIDTHQVIKALNQQNVFATTGQVNNEKIHLNIDSNAAIEDIAGFGDVTIRLDEQGEVKLRDVAEVELGSYNESLVSLYNGIPSTVVSVAINPYANPLTLIDEVKALIDQQSAQFPYDLQADVIVDSTEYIKGALHEVMLTVLIAVGVVFLTLFLFTGTMRTVVIPLITIPLSQLGILMVLLAFGYSINTLTLLAMVLAIGIVVDDAIIVYDNILSKYEQDPTSLAKAVRQGAAEIIKPVIAITLTFVTVYIPIMFVGGVIEHLFTEFAITLAGSVLISGLIALSLTPLMCRWLIRIDHRPNSLAARTARGFEAMKAGYAGTINWLTGRYVLGLLVWALALLATWQLLQHTNKELATKEDQGMVMVLGSVSSYKSTEFINGYNEQILDVFDRIEAVKNYNYITGIPAYNQLIAYVRLLPWDQRSVAAQDVQQELSDGLSQVAGVRTIPVLPSYLPGTTGLPFQLVIKHRNSDYLALESITREVLQALRQSGDYEFIISDLQFDTPYRHVNIDRQLASQLGVDVDVVARTLSLFYANRHIQQVNYQNKSYDVIVKIDDAHINDFDNLKNTTVRNNRNQLVQLSAFVDFDYQILPNSLNTFQKQGAVTLAGALNPQVSLSDALERARAVIKRINPTDISIDYAGETRQFVAENNQSMVMLLVTLVLIFLFLLLLYGRAVDAAVIILGSVPLSTLGSVLYLNISGHSLNIFTHIAILTLIGLITKHGILMVRKAAAIQAEQGLDPQSAINQASAHRFRAILMTTISMVVGAIPLYLASGPGAVSREQMGGVIIWGMGIGTLFTLYVLPTLYVAIYRCQAWLKAAFGPRRSTHVVCE